MSGKAQQKPDSIERRVVLVGGASEVLDDALKDFIVEWLIPVLVEKYIRIHSESLIPE
jgi:hypothetical protein